jgi:hypothetical protein
LETVKNGVDISILCPILQQLMSSAVAPKPMLAKFHALAWWIIHISLRFWTSIADKVSPQMLGRQEQRDHLAVNLRPDIETSEILTTLAMVPQYALWHIMLDFWKSTHTRSTPY